jgi:hypothetical protein
MPGKSLEISKFKVLGDAVRSVWSDRRVKWTAANDVQKFLFNAFDTVVRPATRRLQVRFDCAQNRSNKRDEMSNDFAKYWQVNTNAE